MINANTNTSSLPPTPTNRGARQTRFEPLLERQMAQTHVDRIQRQNKNWQQQQSHHYARQLEQTMRQDARQLEQTMRQDARQQNQAQHLRHRELIQEHVQQCHDLHPQDLRSHHNQFDAYQPTLFVSPISRNIGLGHLYDFFNQSGFGEVKDVFIKPGQHTDFAIVTFHYWNVRETVAARKDLHQGHFIKMKYWHSPTDFENWKVFEYKKPSERKQPAGRNMRVRINVPVFPEESVKPVANEPLLSTDSNASESVDIDDEDKNTDESDVNVPIDEFERPERIDYGAVLPSKMPSRRIVINPFASAKIAPKPTSA
jgi:hypothetical protein